MIPDNQKHEATAASSAGAIRRWNRSLSSWRGLALLLMAGHLHAQEGAAVSARFTAVKGVVMISTTSGGEKQAQKGGSIRSGTVIACGTTAGALLKPLPALHLVIYPDSKMRFDGASVFSNGGGNVNCSIIAGKALFHIDSLEQTKNAPIKVAVATEEGMITSKTKDDLAQNEAGKDKSKPQRASATWTVQHDEGRTVVAVSEGMSNVSIGRGSAAADGDVGGQVEVPEGSVIWLYNRGGRVAAVMVDTETGKITNITGGTLPSGDLVEQSKKQLSTPSSSGTTVTVSTPSNPPGTTPGGSPSNPDLSSPRPPLPVVSADTP